jgi:predicted MFS family arabinose efflux permease
MDLPTWEKRNDEKSMWTDVKEGFSYLSGNRRLLYIVGLSYVVATFVAPYNRFVPIFATNVLHVGASGFGLLMSAPGVGATVAALVLASVNKLRVGVRSICACQLGFALSIGLFAFSHQFLLSFLFLAMVGFCQIAGRALSNTAIQTSTPDNLLGRVLSIFFMDRGLWSLGSMLIGALGAVIGMDWTFALCGAICAITAVAVMSISRKYRAEIARRDTERILKTDLGA